MDADFEVDGEMMKKVISLCLFLFSCDLRDVIFDRLYRVTHKTQKFRRKECWLFDK